MTPKEITPSELDAAITAVRTGKVRIRLETAADVLAAVKLKVISAREARKLLGLRPRPQPKQLRKRT